MSYTVKGGVRTADFIEDGIDSKVGFQQQTEQPTRQFATLALDVVASALFWYVLCFLNIPEPVFWGFLGFLFVAIVAYRLYRARTPACDGVEIPYTCGYVSNNDKEMFLVATVHISPRAPKDVEAVIDRTVPDIAMIELDNERLDRMRDVEADEPQEPDPEDLQPIKITLANGDNSTVLAQRALWNAERSGDTISGDIVFDESNPYGMEKNVDSWDGKIALMCRGSPNGEFAPFALKAFTAANAGAEAVLIINKDGKLPIHRIGGGSLLSDLRIALDTCNCGFPPVPVMLLPQEEGEKLRKLCGSGTGSSTAHAEMDVLADAYPRRTLRVRLCQACALMFSGIGILYGIIQCLQVEVGAEFLAAETAATKRNIPCACIDVDLNRFWSRLGWAVIPHPWNIMKSLLSWLAFPRVVFQFLFPPHGNVDVLGSMVLHAISFPFCTWVAFILAGFCSSFVTNHLLEWFGFGIEQAGESTGVVDKEDREVVQTWIMFAIEMYLLPQIYDAVAASRDEAMYLSIVEQSCGRDRSVVVVGAGHANGILQRARSRGL
jgi:pheromone shutdown protein TraB